MLDQTFARTSTPNAARQAAPSLPAASFVLCFVALACLTCAAQVRAQQPEDVNVRERRATAAKSDIVTKDSHDASREAGAKVEARAVAEGGSVEDGVKDKEEAGAAATIEDLKAQLKAAKTSAERSRAQRALIARLTESEQKASAVDELRAMLGEERFDPQGFYNIGNALARLGESRGAADAYRKAIEQRRGNYSRAQNNLGVVLLRLGRWDEAQGAFAAALRLESNSYPEAHYNLGRLHALRGEAGLAINAWTRTLQQQPDHADAAVALARALAEDGDPERGLAVLDAFDKRAARSGADTVRAVALARGEIVAASNVYADAKDDERRAVSSLKTNAFESRDAGGSARPAGLMPLRALSVDQQTYDLLRRARAAREAGRNEEAVGLYRRVIVNRGGYFPPANLELGYALAGLQRNEEAVASLQPVATKEGARYPIAFYHLGRLYEHLGQLPRAVEAFKRAANFYGQENPQFFIDLSRVREKEGDMQAALSAMESYVQASERTGGAPQWARERVVQLRRTIEAAQKTDSAKQ